MNYMKSIDSIRAVAIILVLVFHLFPTFLPGGFIGVDIFFVISGFLITGILLSRSSDNGFYLAFLKGRIRRLVPAYGVVVLITTIVSLVVLVPSEMEAFARSAAASSVFVSNIFFESRSSYFDGGVQFFPLLHTWSLSVEWQFYMVYPLVFFLLRKQTLTVIVSALILLTVVSFAANYYVTGVNASYAFFMTHLRVFEFTLGGLVFIFTKHSSGKPNKHMLMALGTVSVLCLLFLAFYLDKKALFPGTYALCVALLTCVLVYVCVQLEKQQRATFLYQFQPLQFIGKISYSLYLWHWPIIVYAKLVSGYQLELSHYIIICVLTFLLSVLSYYFVENKMRINTPVITKRVFVFSGVFVVISCVFALTDKLSNGFDYRVDKDQPALQTKRWQPFPGECTATQQNDEYAQCKIGDLSTSPSILLLGDSHGQVLIQDLHRSLLQANVSAVFLTKGGCPPLLSGVSVVAGINQKVCLDMQGKIIDLLTSYPSIKHTLIAARWSIYQDAPLYGEYAEYGIKNDASFIQRLDATVLSLLDKGQNVLVMENVPEPGFPVVEYMIRSAMLNHASKQYFTAESTDLMLNVEHENFEYVHTVTHFCDQGKCPFSQNNIPLYFDSNHLSEHGALYLLNTLLLPKLDVRTN